MIEVISRLDTAKEKIAKLEAENEWKSQIQHRDIDTESMIEKLKDKD